jgi:cellulose synthase/poly-beta-1,6-N-acetylglucosamine synthase-like glycosyltransferase
VEWVFHFGLLIVVLEFPRYYFPQIVLLVLHFLGKLNRPAANLDVFFRREPFVSVVVAGRNEAPTITYCIESLVDQDYPNYEVIIVDDHSSPRRAWSGPGSSRCRPC